MSYELRRDETLADGLRRIARKQIELALDFATVEHAGKDTPVHEARKCLKKTRAVLQLVRKEMGKALFQKRDRALRKVGRNISELRDAEVRLQTVRQLQGFAHRDKKYRQLEEMLDYELENFAAAFSDWPRQAVPMLKRIRTKIESWPIDHFNHKKLRRAVQRSYRRARKALEVAKARPSPETFHAFRSEAKQLGYELRVLRPVNPVVLDNLTGELRLLGELLGRVHDLGFLDERLRREGGHSRVAHQARQLLAVTEATGSGLQRAAAELGGRLFAQRPRAFGRHLARSIEEWHRAESFLFTGEFARDGRHPVPRPEAARL